MKNGEHREMSRAGDAGNDVQEPSNGINQNCANLGLPKISPIASLGRFFCVDFIASGIVFLLVLVVILSIILTTPFGSLIKKGGVLFVIGLCFVDFAIFKIMLLPVINNKVKEK